MTRVWVYPWILYWSCQALTTIRNVQCCQMIRGWTVPVLGRRKGWGLLVVGNWSMQCYVVTAREQGLIPACHDVWCDTSQSCDMSWQVKTSPTSTIMLIEVALFRHYHNWTHKSWDPSCTLRALMYRGSMCVSKKRCCSLVYRVMNLNWFWKCFNWWKMHQLMVM